MVQRTVGLIVTLAALVLPASAIGGQYKVVTCQWPGANGANNSWVGEYGGFAVPPQPDAYRLTTDCAAGHAGLAAQSASGVANYLTLAQFKFTAPAGTRILRLEITRAGEQRRYSTDPGRDNGWAIYGQDGDGNVIGGGFGETCRTSASPDVQVCTIPHPGGPNPATFDLNTTSLQYGVFCQDQSGCQTNYGGYPLASMAVQGAAVTLDDPSNPVLKAGGPLLSDGWVPANAKATADASDNTGISAVKLRVDGADTGSAATPCDFTKPVPCGNVKGASLGLGSEIADGTHTISVLATDAGGNTTTSDKRVQIDGHAPSVSVGLPRRGRFTTGVTDGASGVGKVVISGRDSKGGDLRPLRLSKLGRGRIVGFYNRKIPASRLILHVEATDHVGNTATQDGRPSSIRPSRSRVGAGFGRAVTIRGRLVDAAGRGVANQALASTTTARETGAGTEPGPSATTGRGGRFALRVPGGLSRDVRLTFAGGSGALGTRRTVIVAVPARTTFSAPRSVRGRGRVTFRGTVNAHGQAIPSGGLSILIQGRQGGTWRTFKAARTDRAGRWRASYRFSGRPGTFTIRATVRRNPAFPFDTGASAPRRVRVR